MTVSAKRRTALLVAAENYNGKPLNNCISDARKVKSQLEARGFDCKILENPNLIQFEDTVRDFIATINEPEISIFYFAGHALEYAGTGFLIPCDYPSLLSALSVKHYAIPVATIADGMNSKTGTKIIILDACRIWPSHTTDAEKLSEFIQTAGIGERKWDNTIIAYSTSAGDAASDGAPGRNSQYCLEFCKQLVRHDLTVEECFRNVGEKIITQSGAKQRPWYYSSLRLKEKFSDLTEFQLITAYKLPFEDSSLLYLSPGHNENSVLVAGRESHLWETDMSGFWRAGAATTDKIVASCVLKGGVAVISDDGDLTYTSEKSSNSIGIGVKYPHGVITDGSSSVVVFGMDGWAICKIIKGVWKQIFHAKTDWSIHTGIFLAPYRVWLGGSLGHLIELKWNKNYKTVPVGDCSENINTLCRLPRGSVLCGGDLGMLLELDSASGKILNDFQRDRSVTTASMKRQSLLNRIDNGRILRYIFDRNSIHPKINELLDSYLMQCRVMFAHTANELPLIAYGNNEGIVEIIDIRDGQTVQRIDAQSGLGTDIQGIRFISDTQLVTLSNAGVVRFYASQSLNSGHSGPFLKSDVEDTLIIQQGLDD